MTGKAERVDRRTAILLALLVWFSAVWFGSWEWNPNNSTRLFAAISLVENGDATIDEFADLTIDKARFGDHFYLDKAPGMTLAALPAVALLNLVTGKRAGSLAKWLGAPDLQRFLRLRLRVAVALGPALVTAIAAVLLYDLALGLTASASAALFAALGYALGTPIWGWSTTLFGHAVVAALYVVAVWAVWRGAPKHALLAGAALGWAVAVEYQAVLAGGAIALWAAWRYWSMPGRWRLLVLAVVGGLVALLPLLGYNLVAYGTPFRLSYQGVVGFEGMNQGLFGLTWPRPEVLREILIGGRRGLIWVAPVLVLAPFGLAALWRRRRDLSVIATAVIVIVLLVNASYVYWDGGHSTGPRHAMPAVGLLALGLAPFWADLASAASRLFAAGLLALSMAINLTIASSEIVAPDTYAFPLWNRVFVERFRPGYLYDLPSQFWGWSPWTGLSLYLILAVPLLILLIRRVHPSPTGAQHG